MTSWVVSYGRFGWRWVGWESSCLEVWAGRYAGCKFDEVESAWESRDRLKEASRKSGFGQSASSISVY